VRIHCHFNILALLVADFISADYPYLRQITECAADLVIGSLERRFLRWFEPPFAFDVDRDVLTMPDKAGDANRRPKRSGVGSD
jgi:hypothetical protein